MERFDLGDYFLRTIEYTQSDMEDIFEYASDEEVTRYLSFPTHKSLDDTKWAFDNVFFKLPDEGFDLPRVIVDKKRNKVIGMVNIHNIDFGSFQRPEIGYVLNKKYWGMDIMPKASKAIINHAFEVLGYKEIHISHDMENNKSRRVIEKIGFVHEKDMKRIVKGKELNVSLYTLINNL